MTWRTPSLLVPMVIGVWMHVASSVVSAQVYAAGSTQEILSSLTLGNATSDVAYDPQNDVYLVVTGYQVPSGFDGLWGIFVDRAGEPLGARFAIYKADNYYVRLADRPRVVYSTAFNSGAGGFYVTWRQQDETWGRTYLRGRGVTYPDGLAGVERILWTTMSADGLDTPLMAYSATNSIGLLVYSTSPPAPAPPQIYAKLVDLSGVTPTAWLVADGVPGDLVWNPRMDEFAIAYRSADGGTPRLVRLSARGWGPGTILGDEAVSRSPVPLGQAMDPPALALNADTGNYVMVWSAGDPSSEAHTFFSAEIAQNGQTIATDSIGVYNMRRPSLSFDGTSGTFAIVALCTSASRSQEICALQLNAQAEVISDAVQVTSSDRFLSTAEGPPRAVAGAGARWVTVFASETRTFTQAIATNVRDGGAPGPVLGALCQGADPFTFFGGGVCVNGGWVPRNHPVAERRGSEAPTPRPCETPDPFTFFGGGVCVNGGWVTKDHPLAKK